jgi:hypothetical protein
VLPDSVSRRLIPIQSARILMNERQFVPDPRPLDHAATKNPPGCSSSSLTTRPRRPLSSAFRLLTARCLPRLVHCTTCHSLVVVLYRQRWPSTNVVRCADSGRSPPAPRSASLVAFGHQSLSVACLVADRNRRRPCDHHRRRRLHLPAVAVPTCGWFLPLLPLMSSLVSCPGLSRAKAAAQQPEPEDDELQSLRPSRTLSIDR